MKTHIVGISALMLVTGATAVNAFDSGSTGADGAFAPASDVAVVLPPDGVLNYTTFVIPEGVIVTYVANAANTPAIVLVQGDAQIDGHLDLDGPAGPAPPAVVISPRPVPPAASPGGAQQPSAQAGANGRGPGAGTGGTAGVNNFPCGGSGAGHANAGSARSSCTGPFVATGGAAYGNSDLTLLLGGSGGGGGALNGAAALLGTGGGYGGGALLLAVSGTLTINGLATARGGDGGTGLASQSAGGGGGSGGAMRLIATTIAGAGTVDVSGGTGGDGGIAGTSTDGGAGSMGRIRIETEGGAFGNVIPAGSATIGLPGTVVLSDIPTLRISAIAGEVVPLLPTGIDDVVLPPETAGPVTVVVDAQKVPVGTVVTLTVNPVQGAITTQDTVGLAGVLDNSTASAEVTFAEGASAISASATFSLPDPMAFLGPHGEAILAVEITARPGERSEARYIAENGARYPRSALVAVVR